MQFYSLFYFRQNAKRNKGEQNMTTEIFNCVLFYRYSFGIAFNLLLTRFFSFFLVFFFFFFFLDTRLQGVIFKKKTKKKKKKKTASHAPDEKRN